MDRLIFSVLDVLISNGAPQEDVMISPGQTLENPVTGERFTFTDTAASTNGKLLAFELALRPGGAVPIPHVHPIQTERFEIVDGYMRFRVGRRTRLASTASPTRARARLGCASRSVPRWPWRRCSPRSSRWRGRVG